MSTLRPLARILALAALAGPLAAQSAPPDRAALEAAFAAKLTGARLMGSFTDDAQPEGAPLQRDSYTLGKVEKLESGKWRFESVIEYGGKSYTIPLTLDVLWAGDTPVITLTDYKVPLLGTFTARVLFHGDDYVGVWRGAAHGGQMFGRVIAAAEEAAPAPAGGGGDDAGGDDADAGGTAADSGEDSPHWPSFRGWHARGRAEGWATPERFDVESGENVRWRVPVEGLAHSSPVVWGERLYLTTAVPEAGEPELTVGLYGSIAPVEDEGVQRFQVLCVDKRTGERLWTRTAWEGEPRFKRHPKGSFAAPTPATDGAHVVSFFGTEGLYCHDRDGELLWQLEFGPLDAGFYMVPDAQWGFSSSPVIHDGRVIVQVDVQGDSFVGAFDVRTGEELWVTPRDEVPTFGSPTVCVGEGRAQVVCNGWKHIGGYDLETGAELWKLRGGGDIPVPTPVAAHGLVFVTNAHGRTAPIYAVELGAEGELALEHEHMAWSTTRRGNYMQTPLVYGEELYCCADNGRLICYDARTGEERYAARVGDGATGFTASMVAADGKLYATSETGEVHTIRAGTEYEPLATSALGEECMATPAVSEGVLYWRTRGHLVAVGGA